MISVAQRRCATRHSSCRSIPPQPSRSISNSPYGRTHVWKRRPPVLPKPVVAQFPQRVVRSDGSSFTHWTTSPISSVYLTRDTTNNPLYNTGVWSSSRSVEEESATAGRLGRFNRKFEDLREVASAGVDWLDDMSRSVEDMSAEPEKGQGARDGKE